MRTFDKHCGKERTTKGTKNTKLEDYFADVAERSSKPLNIAQVKKQKNRRFSSRSIRDSLRLT